MSHIFQTIGVTSITDVTDASKVLGISLAGASTATATNMTFAQTANRTWTWPDASDTVVGTIIPQTITSKTIYEPTLAGISAAGTTQGTATALSNMFNIVSTVAASSGVSLPVSLYAGLRCVIANKGANTLNIYPATGAAIDAAATNAAITLAAGAVITLESASTTQWYSTVPTITGSSNIAVSYGTSGQTVISSTGLVNSVSNEGSGSQVYDTTNSTSSSAVFRTLLGTANGLTVTQNANNITIDNTLTGSNLGSGTGIFNAKSGASLQLNSIANGTGIGLSLASNTITLSNTGVLSVSGTTNQVAASTAAGAVTLSTPTQFVAPGTIQDTTGMLYSTSATVSAAGTNQSGATALTTSYNVITTAASGSGVRLPTITTSNVGYVIDIVNRGANVVNVYPATGAAIDGAATNAAISLPANATIHLNASSTTQWYSVSPPLVSGTNTSVTYGNGNTTVSVTGLITTVSNEGSGAQVYDTTNSTSSSAVFRTILGTAADGITVTQNATTITLDNTLTGANLGSGTGLFVSKSGSATLQFNSITNGTGIGLSLASNTITLSNSGVLSVTGTANQITAATTAGAVALSTPAQFVAPGTIQDTTGMLYSTTASVSAAGTNQSTATGLTTSYNVVTTAAAGSGVKLPAITATNVGYVIDIVNKGANALNIYPATGAAIDGLGANLPVLLPVNATIQLDAASTTQWYTMTPPVIAGSNTTVTYGNGGTTVNVAGVIASVSNEGSGSQVYDTTNSTTSSAVFRTILGTAADGITVTQNATTITLDNTLTGANLGSGTGLFVSKSGSATLQFNSITNGTGIGLSLASNTITLSNTGILSVTGTANQVTASTAAGAVTLSTPLQFVAPGTIQDTTGMLYSTSAGVSAAGTTQSTATGLTTSYNVVTTAAASSGVKLPTITATNVGYTITIVNKGANPVNVYPATGASIDSASTNAAIVLPVNAAIILDASSTTQWYTTAPPLVAGTGATVTYGNGATTVSNAGVTSIVAGSGIMISGSTGAVTVTNTGVTTWSAGTTGFTPSTATAGGITLAGILSYTNGGTGLSATPSNGQLPIGNGSGYSLATITPTANQVAVTNGSGTITLSTPTQFVAPGTIQDTTGMLYSTSATVSAAGTTQSTATALTKSFNVITTAAASSGVVLPTITATNVGFVIDIVNRGANPVNIYPALGSAIDGATANAAVTLPVNASITLDASSTTQWYTVNPPIVAGTGATVTYGNGQTTIANAGVLSAAANGGTAETGALNFVAGTGITIVDSPAGTFTISGSGSGVSSFVTTLSGLTPSTAATGAVTLAGTLNSTSGGTGTGTAPSSGQILVGTSGGQYVPYTLASGTGISTTTGSGTLQINNTGATSIAGTTNQVTASASTGAVTLSTPSTFIAPGTIASTTTLTAGTFFYDGTTSIAAAGTTQGTATAITSSYVAVTSSSAGSTGVVLPTPAAAGQEITVVNKGSISINVYPASGASIDSAASNAAVVIPVNGTATYQSISTTKWYTIDPVLVAGTATSITYGNGQTTVANTGVTSVAGTTNQITASASTGAVTLSTPTTFTAPGSVTSTTTLTVGTFFIEGTASIAAAGTTQGTATAIAKSYIAVTSASVGSTGVVLPTPTAAGQEITVVNKGSVTINVYPASGGAIDSAGSNAAVALPVNGTAIYQAISTTQWYTIDPVLVAGTGATVTFGNGQTTIANSGVTSVAGTANQITASASTGAVTLSTPATFVAPGTIASSTTLTAGTFFYEGATSIAAAGTTQGTATAITSSYVAVTSSSVGSTGVVLPTPAAAGQEIKIVNLGSVTVNVYPASGGAIDSAGSNTAVTLPVNGTATYQAISTTQWYTIDPVLVAGTGATVTYGNGQTTIANSGVTSIAGTANQITVSASTGAVTVAIANNAILPGTADVTIPSGTTTQRPSAATDAMLRFNSTEEIFEGYASQGSGNYTGTYTPFSDLIGMQKTLIYRKTRVWIDDFMSTQGYGELGWYVNGTGTWATTFNVATTDHPGQITLSVSGSAGNHVTLALSGSPTIGNIMASQISYFSFIVNTISITTAVLGTNVGIGDQINNDNRIGNNSVFFSFYPSVSANILFYTQSGSTLSTAIQTAPLVAGRWYFVEAWQNAAGTTWYCAVNGVNYGGISTNIPTVAVTPGINCQTLNGTAMSMYVDYFSMITNEMGNRYP